MPGDAREIDARYGLEPVYEPRRSSIAVAGPTEFASVACPYCGESFGTHIDLSAGAAVYVEDCQVCCKPIELGIETDANGALAAVSARRTD
jgi:hypothetical protein